MQPMKLDVLFAFFAYGGNGGIAMQLPEITTWFSKLCLELRDDERIGRFAHQKFGDVPLTMERNRVVATAKEGNFDVIVMIDSDNVPDLYVNSDPSAKPFFTSSFDFLYERKQQGLPSVVAAPYCGPPPHPVQGGQENVYVFRANDRETDELSAGFSFEPYSRQEAARASGIEPMAAGPTGCIMYSTDAFDLMPVNECTQAEIFESYKRGEVSLERALHLVNMQSWFFYEFTNMQQTEKASTEDVTNTREIQLAGHVKHNTDVCFCNWDAWAGHYKPKCVGKPAVIGVGQINGLYRAAVEDHLDNTAPTEEMMDADFSHAYEGNGADREEPVEAEEQPQNLPEITYRMIGERKVKSVGHVTPEGELNALTMLVEKVGNTRPNKTMRVVEVGSWVGESAIALHNGFSDAGGTVWCVDTWEGSDTDWTGEIAGEIGMDALFSHFCGNVGDLMNESIKVLRGDSVDIATSMEDPQGADIVYLDAAHDYESVKEDMEAWMRHVADDGVLCGHDYCDAFPGVQKAVKEACDTAGMTPMVIDGTTLWVIPKNDWLQARKKRDKKRKVRRDATARKTDTASKD